MDLGKNLFTVQVVRHWNRMARESLDTPSLAVFKVRLEGALSNLAEWKVPCQPPRQKGWNWMTFEVPFQPKPLNDSVMKTVLTLLITALTHSLTSKPAAFKHSIARHIMVFVDSSDFRSIRTSSRGSFPKHLYQKQVLK